MPALITWGHCCGLEMTQSIMGQQVRAQLPTSRVLEGGQRHSKEASYFHKCMSPSDLLPPTMSPSAQLSKSLPENATSCGPSPGCVSLLRTLHTRAATRTNRFPEGFDRDGERKSRGDFRAFCPSSTKGSLTKLGEGSSEEEPAPTGNKNEVLFTQVCASTGWSLGERAQYCRYK